MFRLTIFIFFALIACGNTSNNHPGDYETAKDYTSMHAEALRFCKNNNLAADYYFLVDLSVHSGRNRFFVYDFKQQKIIQQNLVTHGACDVFEPNATPYQTAKYSNRVDSHCSAIGKYKIGKRDYSSWGIKVKYWLHGLDETNANAQDRVIVLHSWEAVSDTEIYPDYSPLSWGCPAVSNDFMQVLDAKLKTAPKPVLLWVVN